MNYHQHYQNNNSKEEEGEKKEIDRGEEKFGVLFLFF